MTKVKITLYGGVNEIGGNKFLLEEGNDRILLDFGTSIGARNLFLESPFLEPRTNSVLRDLFRLGLLPDIQGVYRDDYLTIAKSATDKDLPESAQAWRKRNNGENFVQGVLLTHAHVDHFQDISFLDPDIPVHCTETTHTMLQVMEQMKSADVQEEIIRIRERQLGETSARTALGAGRPVIEHQERQRQFSIVEEMKEQKVGNFRVLPIPADHSVPGACAFLIKTPGGKTILYTGDIRFHGNLAERTQLLLKAFDGSQPDILLCEGTRIDSESTDSEADVQKSLIDIVNETKGLAVTEFAWKDTTRFDTIQNVAKATGRTLLVDPRLASLVKHLEGKPGVPSRAIESYGHVKTYVRRRKDMLDEMDDYNQFESGYRFGWKAKDLATALKDKDEAFLGEALAHYRHGVRAAQVLENPSKYIVHLTFWSSFELMDLAPSTGSRWIRCQTEPYNDEMAFTLDRQRRWLEHFGLEHNLPATDNGDDGILRAGGRVTHVSGHGARPDLVKLIKSAQSKVLVPIHTAEKGLDHFDGLAGDVRTFRGVTHRDAGRGKCVVEL